MQLLNEKVQDSFDLLHTDILFLVLPMLNELFQYLNQKQWCVIFSVLGDPVEYEIYDSVVEFLVEFHLEESEGREKLEQLAGG